MRRVLSFLLLTVSGTAIFGMENKQDSLLTATVATDSSVSKTDTNMLELTLSELAGYNGKNGAPAYVAVDSVIYDFSVVKAWKSGKHHGHRAGTDATKELKASPHGKMVLRKKKIVGRLVASHDKSEMEKHE